MEVMDWIPPITVGLIAFAGSVVGAAAIIKAKTIDPAYLEYLDRKKKEACVHNPVISSRTAPYCENCGSDLSKDDLVRLNMKKCNHYKSWSVRHNLENGVVMECEKCGLQVEDHFC